jgi:hypothetical protein
MRSFLVIPIVLAALAVGAWLALKGLHVNVHGRDIAAAAIVCGVSAELALIPAWLRRNAGMLALFQAGLIGTVLHLVIALLIGVVMTFAHAAADTRTFLYLLIAFFWVSLMVMVMGLARLFREASPAPSAAAGGPQPTTTKVS